MYTKAAEAAESARLGAHEIDMVIDVGAAVGGDFGAVQGDIEAVRRAAPAAAHWAACTNWRP